MARIWALTWPSLLYSVLELSLGLADLLMVRSLGYEATAAIGLNRQVTFLLEATSLAVASGVIALVSQGIGASNEQQVARAAGTSLQLVAWIGIPVSLVGWTISAPLLQGLQASPETMRHGVSYLQIYLVGTVFLWMNVVGAAIFRGTGDAVTPLKLACVTSVLNVGLNYLFIFGGGPIPPFGVAGAALGTVTARIVGSMLYVTLLTRGVALSTIRWQPWRPPDWSLVRRILRIGAWPALAGVLRNGARLVFLALLGTVAIGTSLHAAVGVGLQVRLVSVLPALAFQVATSTLVGQAIGAGALDAAESVARRSLTLLAAIMAVVVGATFLFADAIASLFIADASVLPMATTVLRWFAVAQFFSSLSICTQGALTGAGDTRPILSYTVFTQWGLLLSLTAWFVFGQPWVPDGPLLAWVIAPAVQLWLMQRLFLSGRWRSMKA